MTTEAVNKMLEVINRKIDYAMKQFYQNNMEWSSRHRERLAEIDGMIDMLSIVTGKAYIITEKGLIEEE